MLAFAKIRDKDMGNLVEESVCEVETPILVNSGVSADFAL